MPSTFRSSPRARGLAVLLLVLATIATTAPAGADTAPSPDTGGKAQIRIVGGKQSDPGAWPSQVAILDHRVGDNFNAQFCGGTALSVSWVLSAGHCFDEGDVTPASQVDVLSETNDLNAGGRRVRAAEIRQVPGWNNVTLQNDITLVRLDKPVNAPGMPIIDQGGTVPAGTTLVTTGWGNTSADPQVAAYPNLLREVSVPMVANDACQAAYPANASRVYLDSMFCAGYQGGGKDSCNGDSGGPISRKVGDTWVQVGVVSWGQGCAQAGYPGVYTRLAFLSNWIKAQIRWGPFSTSDALVRRQYVDFYGRQPTTNELNGAVQGLKTTAVSSYLAKLQGSDAWQSRAGATARLYRAFFVRDADAAGLKTWVAKLQGGWSIQQVANFFSTSKEFTTTYGGLSNSQFVQLVYQNVLHRAADDAGLTYWSGELDGGRKTRGAVMAGFSESKEFRSATRARTDVTTTFFALLRRIPSAGEYTTWLPRANVDLTRMIAASFSYANRF